MSDRPLYPGAMDVSVENDVLIRHEITESQVQGYHSVQSDSFFRNVLVTHLIEKWTVVAEVDECPICLDNVPILSKDLKSEFSVKTPCGHLFGNRCLHDWLLRNDTCPFCRYEFFGLFEVSLGMDGKQWGGLEILFTFLVIILTIGLCAMWVFAVLWLMQTNNLLQDNLKLVLLQ